MNSYSCDLKSLIQNNQDKVEEELPLKSKDDKINTSKEETKEVAKEEKKEIKEKESNSIFNYVMTKIKNPVNINIIIIVIVSYLILNSKIITDLYFNNNFLKLTTDGSVNLFGKLINSIIISILIIFFS